MKQAFLRTTKPWVLCAALALAIPAISARPEVIEISPLAGYRVGGSFQNAITLAEYDLKESPSYGLTIDLHLQEDAPTVEFLFSHQDTELRGNGAPSDYDVTVDVFQIGVIEEFGGGKLRPFLVGLLGATRFDSSEGSDVRFSLGLGGGVKYSPIKHLGLRVDARGYCTVVEGSGSVFCSGGCLVIYSGSSIWQGEVSASVTLSF